MSQTTTQWDKSGISIVIEPKSKSKKLSAGAYKLVTLDAFNASYISATAEMIASKGTQGIRVVNDGAVPTISNGSTYSILYTGYQGSAPPLLNWIEVPVTVDASGNFSLLVENTLPLAFYRLKLRLYDGVTQKDFAEKTITTPDDSVFVDVNALKAAMTAVQGAAANAQATADGAIVAYYQTTAPAIPPASTGDLWFDTDDKNKLYTVQGGAWVVAQDQRIGDAIAAASNAQGTADGKAKIWYQTTAPIGLTAADTGDLWVDTDDNMKVYAWTGTAWALAQDWITANANATSALNALNAIADDGWLNKGSEKVNLIARFNAATNDKNTLIDKAKSFGVGYSGLQDAYNTLSAYLLSLAPAWNDVTVDTSINPSTTFITNWVNFDTAKTKLLTALQGISRTVDVVTTANQSIPTPASQVFDGYTLPDQKKVLLAGQTTTSQNGIYSLSVNGGYAGGRINPATGATGSTTSPSNGTSTRSFTWASGQALSGTLYLNLTTQSDSVDAPVVAYYSLDGGVNWTTWGTFTDATATAHTLSIAVSNVLQANLQIRVTYTGATIRTTEYIPELGHNVTTTDVFYSTVNVTDVYYQAASTAPSLLLTKLSSVYDGEIYLCNNGSTYGNKNVAIAVNPSTLAITLTATDPIYQAKLPAYSSAPAKVLQNVSGALSWADPASGGGGTWGSITGTLSSQTDLQTALNGKQASLGFTPWQNGTALTATTISQGTSGDNATISFISHSASANTYIKFLDTQIGGQTTGLAYFKWTRDSSQGRALSIYTCDSSSTSRQALLLDYAGNTTVNNLTATNGYFSGSVSVPSGYGYVFGGSGGIGYITGDNNSITLVTGGSTRLYINNSSATFNVGVYASSFNGSGSGLTGTASSLTAGKANNLGGGGSYTGEDNLTFAQRSAKGINIGRSQGATDAPGGETSTYFSYLQMPEAVSAFGNAILAIAGSAGGNAYIGNGGSTSVPTWSKIITSANIAAQSVNYATSSGTAGTATNLSGWNLNSNRLAAQTTIDSLTTTNFKTKLFGSSANGNNIATARWDNVPAPISGMGMYGTMIAWGASDTQGFLALNYNGAGAKIGGGNGDSINWSADLITSANIGGQSVNYANSAGSAGAVTVNYNNDSNSTYQMLWGSGNNVYGTAGIYCNPYTDTLTVGTLISTGNSFAYYTSDASLKTSVEPIKSALSKVNTLQGVTYEWTEKARELDPNLQDRREAGLLAQQVQAVLPEVVIKRDNGYLALDYPKVIPLLVEAIKELSGKVERLEAR